jgi:Holliday junction resolvasome RuvABC endonuclease subunit
MISTYLGIDPGLNGGFAVVSGDTIRYKMAMPTLSFTTREGKTKTEIDRQAILSVLAMQPKHTHVAIEEQQAFRSQNITATCTTCRNYGILLMGLSFAHLFITEVPSDLWQAHFGIVSVEKGEEKTTKEQAFHIAHALYPNADFRKSERSRNPHDGMVDATLIASYCQSLFAPFLKLIEPLEVKPIPGADGIVKPLECKSGGKVSGTELKREMF